MEPKIILEIPKLQLKSLKIFIQSYKSQTLGYESQFLLHFCGEKCHIIYLLYIGIIIGIGRYEKYHIGILSVSADKKMKFIGLYRYRPI